MSNDIGSWFEDKVAGALKEIQDTHKSTFHRFPDSKAARNLLSAQPGDHQFMYEGMTILLEEKCSEAHSSLRGGFSALWDKRQAGFHRKWHRAGIPSAVLFCDYCAKDVEIWDGIQIATARVEGERVPAEVEPIVTCPIKTLTQGLMTLAKYMREHKDAYL